MGVPEPASVWQTRMKLFTMWDYRGPHLM
jgi:hypothetical protein